MDYQLGYCTNVHAGTDLPTTRWNLAQHALAVKRAFCPDQPLGIGLWLSHSAASQLDEPAAQIEFRKWLDEAGLVPFTFNGFPFGDFHGEVVKHDVYRPDWCDPQRVEYTLALIRILDGLLPAGQSGSISTLPLAWGNPPPEDAWLAQAAENLLRLAAVLAELEERSGRWITLCLEPEPGCALGCSEDAVRFFERFLFRTDREARVRRYLRICHDTCHAAVMGEDQASVLDRYRHAGIGVGKLQISSALVLPLQGLAAEQRERAVAALRGFAEDRYLHQSTVRLEPGGPLHFFADLPETLDWLAARDAPDAEVRVHFHVPIYLEACGLLRTTQPDIRACWQAALGLPELQHIEVETYAWTVLPVELRRKSLADGIAEELRWFRDQFLAQPTGG